jgi:hypothetical protein
MSGRIGKNSALATLPLPGPPRKRGAYGAFSWGRAKEGS